MDDVDRANEIEAALIQRGLRKIHNELREVSTEINCIECDEEIDEERRKLVPNAIRCFRCQDLYERPRRVKRF